MWSLRPSAFAQPHSLANQLMSHRTHHFVLRYTPSPHFARPLHSLRSYADAVGQELISQTTLHYVKLTFAGPLPAHCWIMIVHDSPFQGSPHVFPFRTLTKIKLFAHSWTPTTSEVILEPDGLLVISFLTCMPFSHPAPQGYNPFVASSFLNVIQK